MKFRIVAQRSHLESLLLRKEDILFEKFSRGKSKEAHLSGSDESGDSDFESGEVNGCKDQKDIAFIPSP